MRLAALVGEELRRTDLVVGRLGHAERPDVHRAFHARFLTCAREGQLETARQSLGALGNLERSFAPSFAVAELLSPLDVHLVVADLHADRLIGFLGDALGLGADLLLAATRQLASARD